MKNRIKPLQYWVRDNISLAIAALFIIIITGVLYKYDAVGDLGPNLFSEALGLACGVIIINQVIKNNENQKTKSARFAAYIETNRLLSVFCETWANMVKSSVREPYPTNIDLFDQEYIDLIANNLDTEIIFTGIVPNLTWREYSVTFSKDISYRIDRIFRRYLLYAEPTVISLLTEIEDMSFLKGINILSTVRELDRTSGRRQSNRFIFFPTTRKELLLLKDLHRALQEQSTEFVNLEKYVPPYDISFQDCLSIIKSRNITVRPVLLEKWN